MKKKHKGKDAEQKGDTRQGRVQRAVAGDGKQRKELREGWKQASQGVGGRRDMGGSVGNGSSWEEVVHMSILSNLGPQTTVVSDWMQFPEL